MGPRWDNGVFFLEPKGFGGGGERLAGLVGRGGSIRGGSGRGRPGSHKPGASSRSTRAEGRGQKRALGELEVFGAKQGRGRDP